MTKTIQLTMTKIVAIVFHVESSTKMGRRISG